MSVPDEAVEAAAKEVYHTSGRYRVMPYSQAKEDCEAEATRILEAAAPFIAAQAWDDGFEKGSDWGEWASAPVTPEPDTNNPYRSDA